MESEVKHLIDFHKGNAHAAQKQIDWYRRELNDPGVFISKRTEKEYHRQIKRYTKRLNRYLDTISALEQQDKEPCEFCNSPAGIFTSGFDQSAEAIVDEYLKKLQMEEQHESGSI